MWFRFAIYKNAPFFICTFVMLAAATVANIKICYEAKTPQFAIFWTRVIYVFYSTSITYHIYIGFFTRKSRGFLKVPHSVSR